MKLNEKNTLVYVIIVAILLASSVLVLREFFYNGVIAGEIPYYHMNSAENMIEKGLMIKQEGYLFSPYHIVLAFAGEYVGIELASKIIPLIFGVLSVIIFYFIMKEFKAKIRERFFIMMILVFSPAFIYLCSFSNNHSIPVFLTLLGVYLLFKKNIFLSILCFFSLALTIPFGIFNAVLVVSIIVAYITNEVRKTKALKKKKIPKSLNKAAVFLILFFVISLFSFSFYFNPKESIVQKESILTELISDLGALHGLGVFSIILAIIGFSIMWKQRKEHSLIFIPLLVMIIFLFYNKTVVVYLLFLSSILAGKAFDEIAKMKWEIKIIKDLTLILIICGILFSTVSYISRTSKINPDENIINSLDWLSHYSMAGETVFSHYSRGFWINYVSGRNTMINQNFEYLPDAERRFNDSNEIFYSRNLEKTKNLLYRYNIDYIWIDEEMKNGLVWEKEDEGLLFLFRNNETFKNIYNNQGIEIWKVKGIN